MTTKRKPTWQQLCREHAVDMGHARAVRRLSLELFHAARPWHQLGDEFIPILDVGALLHNVGLNDDPPNHHTRGREIILARGIARFSIAQTAMIACLVTFHRKKVRADREPLFELIPMEHWLPTLLLAGMLRVADGLDYTQNGVMQITGARETESGLVILVNGLPAEDGEINIARANRKADLWNATADIPMQVHHEDSAPAARAWISAGHPITEAAPRLVRHFLLQVQERVGEGSAHEVTDIHQARVATRRMRSALKVFREAFDREALEPHSDDLRWIAGQLGAVRDDDVFRIALEKAAGKLDLERHPAILRILSETAAERAQHLSILREALASERFHQLLKAFPAFLQEAEEKDPPGPPLRLRAPSLLRRQWKRVRAWHDQITQRPAPEELHELRITIKRLRYTAEFLRGIYGHHLDALVEECTAMQDFLGEIHDIDVFTERLESHGSTDPEDLRAVHRVVVHWLREQAALRGEFAHRWSDFAGREHHRRLLSIFDEMIQS